MPPFHRPAALPTTIPDYLEQLRRSLAGADPALVQDALYDAEEYLRSELAENPGKSEAEVIAAVAGSYGAPDEVADIYRDTEVKVQTALRAPPPPPRKSVLGRFFGVDRRAAHLRARCSTCCCRWRPASSTSPGWSPACRCRRAWRC